MSKSSRDAHSALHMSPAQAAQRAGVSRWTIMRAIKSNEIKAFRDNRNQWRITEEALVGWRPNSERTAEDAHASHAHEVSDEVMELRAKLSAAVSRAEAAERARDQAETDRDRWHEFAMRPWWKRLIG